MPLYWLALIFEMRAVSRKTEEASMSAAIGFPQANF
jgi:hypothetical protein